MDDKASSLLGGDMQLSVGVKSIVLVKQVNDWIRWGLAQSGSAGNSELKEAKIYESQCGGGAYGQKSGATRKEKGGGGKPKLFR